MRSSSIISEIGLTSSDQSAVVIFLYPKRSSGIVLAVRSFHEIMSEKNQSYKHFAVIFWQQNAGLAEPTQKKYRCLLFQLTSLKNN